MHVVFGYVVCEVRRHWNKYWFLAQCLLKTFCVHTFDMNGCVCESVYVCMYLLLRVHLLWSEDRHVHQCLPFTLHDTMSAALPDLWQDSSLRNSRESHVFTFHLAVGVLLLKACSTICEFCLVLGFELISSC